MWQPGEAGASERLAQFIDGALSCYSDARDRPDRVGTSMLSPHLHFGEISPRQVWAAIEHARSRHDALSKGSASFLREVGWREFSYHLLHHWPASTDQPFRPEFAEFPWETDQSRLQRNATAWRKGQTGYPIVDAGMRQLWQCGWMHNRVRMVAASFLTKHLLVPWQMGATWFWDTLVDANLPNNTQGWQWVAGSGADAAPYFRIFNPVLQGQKFDPDGDYVRTYVPELGRLPARYIHAPWTAPAETLAESGVELGRTYPNPIVDHDQARRRALEAYGALQSASGKPPKAKPRPAR
ncbi:MAG: FAD-binding domain-containing protein [Hyphomicrobiaceae bacterium]